MIDSRKAVSSKSGIANFYEGRNVLITGVTGFIGKVRRPLSQQHLLLFSSWMKLKFKRTWPSRLKRESQTRISVQNGCKSVREECTPFAVWIILSLLSSFEFVLSILNNRYYWRRFSAVCPTSGVSLYSSDPRKDDLSMRDCRMSCPRGALVSTPILLVKSPKWLPSQEMSLNLCLVCQIETWKWSRQAFRSSFMLLLPFDSTASYRQYYSLHITHGSLFLDMNLFPFCCLISFINKWLLS